MQVIDIPIDKHQREITHHGTLDFPLAIYCSVMNRNILGFTNWHWHDEMQFCLVTVGSIRFFVGEKQYLLQTGEGIFINSGYLHMAKPETQPDSTYICLDVGHKLLSSFSGSVFESKYVAPYLKDPSMEHIFLCPAVTWQRNILSNIPKINLLYEEKKFGHEFEICTLLGRMWLDLLSNRIKSSERGFHSRIQNNAVTLSIVSYIEQHYSEPISVEMISKAVSFSDSECCRVFKKVTGDTIFSYLQSYRLTKGAKLLLNTELSVSQIAYETGFCSTSYFIEVFNAKFEITPLRYRKKYCI